MEGRPTREVNKTSRFREALREWWINRIKRYKRGERLQPITIRGILYLMRKAVGIENMPNRSGFYAALDAVEKEFEVPRGKLRIITEPKINLVTRFGEKPMLKAEKGDLDVVALLLIEKATIIAAIEEDQSLTDRGIHIVKTMGFSTRDVNEVIRLAQELGVPLFTLTDFDASGILIDLKIQEAGVKTARLGIDLELLERLGIPIEDVREPMPRDPQKLTHFKYLQRTHPELADIFVNVIGDGERPYRIEIDGVFAFAGKERFMDAILERADRVLPVKPLGKVLIVKRVPEKVDKLRWAVYGLLNKLFEDIVEEEMDEWRECKEPFKKIRLSEIEDMIEENINEYAESEKVIEILERTVKEIEELIEST